MGIKISDLPSAGSVDGTELVPIVQTGTTKQTLLSTIRSWLFTNPIALGSGTPNTIAGTTITATSTISGTTITAATQFSGPGTGLTGTSAMNITGWAKSSGAGADIASAATIDLTARTGNIIRITGTTAISAVTMNNGDSVTCIAVGALPLTYHATNMPIQGGASYTCSPGDSISFVKDSSGILTVCVFKKDGSPISGGASLVFIESKTASASSTIDFTTGINSTYDEYLLILSEVIPTTNDVFLYSRISEDGTNWKSGASDYDYQNNLLQNGTNNPSTATAAQLLVGPQSSNTVSDGGVSGELRFFAPSNTTHKKHLIWNIAGYRAATGLVKSDGNGRYISTNNAFVGVRFLMSSGTIASGKFYLYGVKKT